MKRRNSINISAKTKFKNLQQDSKNWQFSLFSIISLWEALVTIVTRVLIRSKQKHNYSFPLPERWCMCYMRTIGPAVSEKKIFEIVDDDGRRTDAGAWVYYKLTYEPSAQVTLKRCTSVYEEYELRIEEYELRMLTYVRRTRDVPFVS